MARAFELKPELVPSLQWKGSGMTYERKAKAKSECCHEKKDNAKQNLLGGFIFIWLSVTRFGKTLF